MQTNIWEEYREGYDSTWLTALRRCLLRKRGDRG